MLEELSVEKSSNKELKYNGTEEDIKEKLDCYLKDPQKMLACSEVVKILKKIMLM